MKNLKLIILLILLISCKKNDAFSQNVNVKKEYTFDYHAEKLKGEDFSSFYGKPEFQLENYIEPITKEQFFKDSISYKNEYTTKKDLLLNSNSLELPYGSIKFINNNNRNSDAYSKYSYKGFSNLLNSHIIDISLYEGNVTLLLSNDKYNYKIIEGNPNISPNKKKLLVYKDNEGLSSSLIVYNLNDKVIEFQKYIWSEDNIINYATWNTNNDIVLKSTSTDTKKINYYKINNLNQKSEKTDVKDIIQNNFSNPDKIIKNLIFTKVNNELVINTEILNYLQKNTTTTNNAYIISLSNYIRNLIGNFYDKNDRTWSEDELFKIIAFASNTTDPLFKKYWKENIESWNNGKEGFILGFCNLAYHDQIWNKLIENFKKNKYYNLPYLQDMTYYGSDFDKTGAP